MRHFDKSQDVDDRMHHLCLGTLLASDMQNWACCIKCG